MSLWEEQAGYWLFKSSGQAAVLILLILAAQALLRHRLAPVWRHSLWWLVVLRLLVPVTPECALSIFNWTPGHSIPTGADPETLVSLQPSEPVIRPAIESDPERSPKPPQSLPAEQSLGTAHRADTPARLETRENVLATTEAAVANTASTLGSPQPLAPIIIPRRRLFMGIWLLGVGMLTIRLARTWIRLHRWLHSARTIEDAQVLRLLEECKTGLRVRRRVIVLETPVLPCPALCGMVRPKLLLPEGLLENFNEPELRHVFLHELSHLKRQDIAANWLTAVLQIVHWFNPLVWLAFHRMRADSELACDARVLAVASPAEPQAYGRTIIKLLERISQRPVAPGLVGILEDQRQLRQRIRQIAWHGRKTYGWALSAILLMGLGIICLTDARTPGTEPKDSASSMMSRYNASSRSATFPTASLVARPVVTNGPSVNTTVLDAETSRPISEAHVYTDSSLTLEWLETETSPRWITDPQGIARIFFGEVSQGSLPRNGFGWIVIRKPGYAPCVVGWINNDDEVRLHLPATCVARLQRGITIGGVVKDHRGRPVPNVQIRVRGNGDLDNALKDILPNRGAGQYSIRTAFWNDPIDAPIAITDRQGRWHLNDYPRDLRNMIIECRPPDGAVQIFRSGVYAYDYRRYLKGDPIDLDRLFASQVEFILNPGFTVSGVVLGPDGERLPGVLVKVVTDNREVVTDNHGRFELRNRQHRQLGLTVYSPGHAITSTVVDVRPDAPEVRLQVQPIHPLRLKVVDENDRPVAGATVSLDKSQIEGRKLDYQATPRADGTLIWTNAPRTALALRIIETNRGIDRLVRLPADRREITCRLRQGEDREVQVRGQARDADTGQPVVLETVATQRAHWTGPVTDFLDDEFNLYGRLEQSEFVLSLPVPESGWSQSPGYRLQLHARGYEPLVSEWRDFSEGDWEPVFKLRKGSHHLYENNYLTAPMRFLLPNGDPAATAVVVVLDETRSLFLNGPKVLTPSDPLIRTDANGQVRLQDTGLDSTVAIIHDNGFLFTSLKQLKAKSQNTLQAWGRVEGVLRVGAQVGKDRKVYLYGGDPAGMGDRGLSDWVLIHEGQTDAEGRFVFEKLPPGVYSVSQRFDPALRGNLISHPLLVQVRAGETTRMTYGGNGRAVIGRVAITNTIDCSLDPPLLILKNPVVDPDDYAPIEAQEEKGERRYRRSFIAQAQCPVYQALIKPDGSFRVDDVPAGPYELHIRVTEPSVQTMRGSTALPSRKVLATRIQDVVLPEMPSGRSDAPLDLGLLTLDWKAKEPSAFTIEPEQRPD